MRLQTQPGRRGADDELVDRLVHVAVTGEAHVIDLEQSLEQRREVFALGGAIAAHDAFVAGGTAVLEMSSPI